MQLYSKPHPHMHTLRWKKPLNERKSSSFTGGALRFHSFSRQHPVCSFVPAPAHSETKENGIGTAPPRAFSRRRQRWWPCWCERAFKWSLQWSVYSALSCFSSALPNSVCYFGRSLYAVWITLYTHSLPTQPSFPGLSVKIFLYCILLFHLCL